MACVWVHPSIVQFTFLPTSSLKGMDCDCMVQVCLSFGLETEMIRIFLALFKEKVAVGYSLYSIISPPLSRS